MTDAVLIPDPLPADVKERAMALSRSIGASNKPMWVWISRALMEERAAERERCAKKCEGDFDSEMSSYGDWFASQIRGQP